MKKWNKKEKIKLNPWANLSTSIEPRRRPTGKSVACCVRHQEMFCEVKRSKSVSQMAVSINAKALFSGGKSPYACFLWKQLLPLLLKLSWRFRKVSSSNKWIESVGRHKLLNTIPHSYITRIFLRNNQVWVHHIMFFLWTLHNAFFYQITDACFKLLLFATIHIFHHNMT